MKLTSALLATGSLWECVRFALAAILLFGPASGMSGEYASTLWFSSPQLVIAGMLVMMALYPVRYARFFKVVILAKVLATASGAAAAVPALLIQGGQLHFTTQSVLVAVIVLGDLMLLGVLIAVRKEPDEV
ncbi:MAG: hypothetical protein ACOCRN_01870 [Spirochaetia bacterium]